LTTWNADPSRLAARAAPRESGPPPPADAGREQETPTAPRVRRCGGRRAGGAS